MNIPLVRMLLTILFLCAVPAGRVLADPIYFSLDGQVYQGPSLTGSVDSLSLIGSGSSRADLTGQFSQRVLAGQSAVMVAWISTSWDFTRTSPYDGGPSDFSQPFILKLNLQDESSQVSGSLLFRGQISGSVTGNWASGSLTFTPSTQSILLGSNRYNVDLTQPPSWQPAGYDMLGPATWFWGVGVTAQVDAEAAGVNNAPEPTGLTLAGMALATMLIGAGWQRWRRRSM